jgi:threonine aldolase
VALGTPASRLVQSCDSVSVCLSKGLCAPVGSLLAGTRNFVREARRYRKMVGGGMRQAGVLAAAGIVGLREMVDRLAEDHANAAILAECMLGLPGVRLPTEATQTNIVVIEVDRPDMDAAGFIAAMAARGVLTTPFGGPLVRMVTHHDVTRSDVETACRVAREVLG